MKTLVIPDVHENIDAVKKILATGYDRVVFLGDWFDRFPTQPGDLLATVEWLEANIGREEFTFLYGNHDMPYAFAHEDLQCSGHQYQHRGPICRALQSERARCAFKLTTLVDGWRLSHAGFAPQHASGDIDLRCELTIAALRDGRLLNLLQAGDSRGGSADIGGCTWLDWDCEFQPVDGIKQIVGHTKGKDIRWQGKNVCLDTGLRHFGVIEDGKFTVHETPAAK